MKLTQQMTCHLNGGNKFSELHYEIFADGKKTGITRHTRTDGSPKYLVVADELHDGKETLDILKSAISPSDWIAMRLEQRG